MAYKTKPAKKAAAKAKTKPMAKRKKTSTAKKTSRRRARVGAVRAGGLDILGNVVAPIAGAVVARTLGNTVLKNATPMLRNVVPIAAGIGLLVFGKKSKLLQGAGVGMVVMGGVQLAGGLVNTASTAVGALLPGSTSVAGMLANSQAVAGAGTLDGAMVSGVPAMTTRMKYGWTTE